MQISNILPANIYNTVTSISYTYAWLSPLCCCLYHHLLSHHIQSQFNLEKLLQVLSHLRFKIKVCVHVLQQNISPFFLEGGGGCLKNYLYLYSGKFEYQRKNAVFWNGFTRLTCHQLKKVYRHLYYSVESYLNAENHLTVCAYAPLTHTCTRT